MKFIHAKQFEILAALGSVSGVVAKRSTLPVLSNVLIRRHGDVVEFIGSDLEAQMRTAVPLGGDAGDYATTLNARKLIDILRTLPAEQMVTIEESGGKTVLKSGRSKFQLQSLPAEDFPLVTESSDFGPELTVKQKDLKRCLDQVTFAAAVQDMRYYLVGVLFAVEAGKLHTIATDGHRLAMTATKLDGEFPDQSVIVPRKAVGELQRLIKTGAGDVTMRFSSNQARFSFDGVEFVTKLVEGKFPDYKRVIPRLNDKSVTIPRAELVSAVQRIALMTDEKFRGVSVTFAPGVIGMDVRSKEGDTGNEEIVTEYVGDEVKIGLNVAYVLDVLGTMDQSMVNLTFKDDRGAICVKRPDDPEFVSVIMPMRL